MAWLFETHSHTPLCRHAVGDPEEYAAEAERQGLRGLTVTCHNPMPGGFAARVRMRPQDFDDYVAMVARAAAACSGQVDVLLGLECDYYPGYEDWLQRQVASADFHYILGSVHPQLQEFRRDFAGEGPRQTQRNYFRLLGDAAETGLFDCLSHPDLVKNVTARHWRPADIWDDILAALDRIANSGVAMELNTSGLYKTIREMNPFPQMLVAMCERGIPVVIGADAHVPQRVGDRFPEALALLDRCGYQEVSYFVERKRQSAPLKEALSRLAASGAGSDFPDAEEPG